MRWPTWRLLVKIPTEDCSDETLAIDDTHGDDVRGGDGHGEVDKVADEMADMEVDISTSTSGATC